MKDGGGLAGTHTSGGVRALRADARRNQSQLLAAAREVFVERGPDAPLEEIAKRAGVGIGTLYRRFTDRRSLLRAVVLEALEHTRQAAERASAQWSEPFDALVAYMHALLDHGVAAVIPLALDRIDMDDAEIRAARDASALPVHKIIDESHSAGMLSEEVTFADIGMMLIRLSRPLPGPIPPDLNARLAHRHLDLLIDGLRAGPSGRALPGPALTLRDLREIRADEGGHGPIRRPDG